jgi:hypothetical protein
MRRVASLQKQPFNAPDVETEFVPVPTDGWDAISPLANMDPKRSAIMINWVPRPGWVEIRQGASVWSQGLPGGSSVETLLVLRQPTTQRMFAATNLAIYEVSTQGAAPTTALASGFSSNRWQYTNFTPPNGTTVIQLVNGSDPLQQYDGTTWSAPSISGLPAGFTTASFTNIFAGKQRLWYTLKNSTIVAFMPVGAITGAVEGFQDFGTLFDRGGFVQAVCDWTIDAGEGPNSYTTFISSEGQIAVYQGVDPGNTSLWSFVGVFNIAKPIGQRCFVKWGTDILLITYEGLVPISKALPYDPSAERSAALTNHIQNAMNQSVQMYSTNFGWQAIPFPLQTLLFLNIPQAVNQLQVQYVMNTLNGAWTQFQGWNANCFELFSSTPTGQQNLFYGDNSGNVVQAYLGGADITAAIAADMQCAFNWFNDPGRLKHIKMIQPLMTTDGSLMPSVGVDVDFSASTATPTTQGAVTFAEWGTATWGVSNWSAGTQQVTSWQGVQANPGKALAVRVKASALPNSSAPIPAFGTAVFGTSVFGGYSSNSLTLQINAFNAIMEVGGYI